MNIRQQRHPRSIKNSMMMYLLTQAVPPDQIKVDQRRLGFTIPTLSDILTFLIRGVFIVGGLLALFNLLIGAIGWITSGGNKEATDKARNRIQAALVGLILIAVVLAVVVTLEQVVFRRALCLGLSCPITIPSLLQPITDTTPTSFPPAPNIIIVTPTPISTPIVTQIPPPQIIITGANY